MWYTVTVQGQVVTTIAPQFAALAACGFALLIGAVWLGRRLGVQSCRAELDAARHRNEDLSVILNNTSDGIVLLTMKGRVLWANDRYLAMHGLLLDDILGRNPLSYALPPEERPDRQEIDRFHFDTADPQWKNLQNYRNIRSDGSLFWNQISISFHEPDDADPFTILVCRDVTPQIEAQNALEHTREELSFAASHDSLTRLANRWSLMTRLSGISARVAAGEQVNTGVFHIDIDQFKQVNDTHGHPVGDAVLCHVADVLATRAGPGALVARPGGDEFIAILPDMTDLDALRDRAAALFNDISTGIYHDGRYIPTSVSIGAALFGPDDVDPDSVLIRSDYALYQAKRTGRGRSVIYDDELRARHQRTNRLGRHLRSGIKEGGLEFEFQPMLDVATGMISGIETLVRWQHPVEGRLPPDHFLDLAVETGLMATLDQSAIDAVFEAGRELVREGQTTPSLGFNASPELLADPELLTRLIRRADASGFCHDKVVIEIRETVVLGAAADRNPAMQTIRRLHDAGFQIVLDGFGTGYAGLTHLAELPLSGIKIDRSLVGRIFDDDSSRKIVLAIADLCKVLGLTLVGEGVETRAAADWLARSGCDRLQGFWLSPALPLDALLEFLAHHDAARYRLPERGDVLLPIGSPDPPALRLHGTG